MQHQAYGFHEGFHTQQVPQRNYQNNTYNNNDYNTNPSSHPFAPPQNHSFQNYPQSYNQGYNRTYDPYNTNNFQNNQNNYGNNYGDDDYPSNGNNNRYQQRETVEPNNVTVGFNQRPNYNDNSYNQPKTNGFSTYNQPQSSQPAQDNNPSNQDQAQETKPKVNRQGTSWAQIRRSATTWTPSAKIGRFLSGLALISIPVLMGILIGLMAYHFGDKTVKLSAISGALNYMVFNLNSDPILSLTVASSICPGGTQRINLGTWPGVDRGCSCPIIGETKGQCSKKQSDITNLVCNDVYSIDPIDMYRWDGSVFCAQRAHLGSDYVKATTCPAGYMQCSEGICVKESFNRCPITAVTVQATPDASLEVIGGRYVISRTQGVTPLIDMDISINNIPCFSNTEVPKGQGDYVLLKQRPEGCLSYGADDLFSARIEETSQNDVLVANNFPSNVLNLPHYRTVLDNTPTILSGRKRITVANNEECLALDTAIMTDAATAANNMNKYVSGTAITALVLHSLLFIISVVIVCTLKRKYSWKTIFSGVDAGSWACPYVGFMVCEFIVYIVMAALVSGARADLITSKDYLAGLDKKGCFPVGQAKQVISDYGNGADEVASILNSYAKALLALTIISFVPFAIYFVYKKCKK